jgi:hypothetical protein
MGSLPADVGSCRTVGRRALLGAGALSGIGLALGGCTSDGPSDHDADGSADSTSATGPLAPDFDPQSWDSVRAQFRLDPDLAHFAAFVLASHPAPVARAIEQYRDALDRDTDGFIEKATQRETQFERRLPGDSMCRRTRSP